MLTGRWEFIGGAAALAFAGCRTSGCNVWPEDIRADMRRVVADGLYGSIVCGSNRLKPIAEGQRTLDPAGGPVTVDSVFDLASVGKTQTASLCALLVADGRIDPDAPFTRYLPEHVLAKENCNITVRDLATHSGGVDNAKPYATPDVKLMFERLYAKRPVWARGEKFCYACSNFVYLGLIVEHVTGLELGAAAEKLLWGPLGMAHTTWNTVVGNPHAVECHPCTYKWGPSDPPRQIGEHNDLCAHWAPRAMGNGSCFSTCGDMVAYVTDLLERRRFPKAYYDLLLTPCFERDGVRRSFGWCMKSAKGDSFVTLDSPLSDAMIIHHGWTGPAIAVDPENDFAGVVLGSRWGDRDASMAARVKILERLSQLAV